MPLYNSRMALPITGPVLFVTILLVQTPATPGDPKPRAAAALAAIAAKDFAAVEAQFDDKMKAALPPGRLAATWEAIASQAGMLKSCGANVRVVAIADKQMVITTCEFERVKIDVQFAFDPSGRISGLVFRPGRRLSFRIRRRRTRRLIRIWNTRSLSAVSGRCRRR